MKSARWEQVGSCTWFRYYDILGVFQGSGLQLNDLSGRKLFFISSFDPKSQRRAYVGRLVDYLALKFTGQPFPDREVLYHELQAESRSSEERVVRTLSRSSENALVRNGAEKHPPVLTSSTGSSGPILSAYIIFGGLFFLAPIYDHDRFEWREHLGLCIVSALVVLVGIATPFRTNRPQVKADESGIEYCDLIGNVKSIPWKDIHSCDFVVIQKSLGTPDVEYVVLRDWQGSEILQIKINSGDRKKDDAARALLAEQLAYQLATPSSSTPPAGLPVR